MGHLLPGSLFMLAGLWWTVNIFRHYFRYYFNRKTALPFRTQPWYSGPFCTNFPFECCVKIFAVTVGMAGELVTAFENGVFEHIGNAQHMTMYFFFGLNGAMDLLKHYQWPLPEGIEAASGILAYTVEGFLFFNHLHGRPHMDVQVHMFLFYVIAACVFSVFLEIRHRNHVIPSLSRAYFTLTQGTWFCQVGFILYPPVGMAKWDVNDHEQMMVVTLVFTWHLAVNMVLMLAIGGVVCLYMKLCPFFEDDDVVYERIITSSSDDSLFRSAKFNGNHLLTHPLLDSDNELGI